MYLEGNMVTICLVLEATSLGVSAVSAPKSFRSATASGYMSWTISEHPLSSKFLAIGAPMFPKPTKPTGP